jgi:hypothetical protein
MRKLADIAVPPATRMLAMPTGLNLTDRRSHELRQDEADFCRVGEPVSGALAYRPLTFMLRPMVRSCRRMAYFSRLSRPISGPCRMRPAAPRRAPRPGICKMIAMDMRVSGAPASTAGLNGWHR